VILYIETNFLMAVATGRDPDAHKLLAVTPPLVLALPTIACMEAFSALEDDIKGRNRFGGQLDQQIGQLRRDNTSSNASALLANLEQAKLQNARLVNDVQARLFELVKQLSSKATLIDTPGQTLHDAVDNDLVEREPTDNLILHTILHHAKRHATETKALLTENANSFGKPEPQSALAAAGIKSFNRSGAFLEWGHNNQRAF
jgi:hypothetical protein